jgi:hypothetical protein
MRTSPDTLKQQTQAFQDSLRLELAQRSSIFEDDLRFAVALRRKSLSSALRKPRPMRVDSQISSNARSSRKIL